MPADRYFIDSELSKGGKVVLEGEELHHLVSVMRGRVGDRIQLVNGRGALAEAAIVAIEKKRAALEILVLSHEAKKQRELILAQAIPRFNRLEFILEKGTELGVTQFWLFPGDGSEKNSFSPTQMKRMESLILAAMKQCGRLDLPKITMMPPLSEWEPMGWHLFFGDVRSETPRLQPVGDELPVLIFIGPEKGFSADEVDILETRLNARGVSLHHNILRVDTAAIVGLAQLS